MAHRKTFGSGKTRENDKEPRARGSAKLLLTSEHVAPHNPFDAFRQAGASMSRLTDFPIRNPEEEKDALQNGQDQWVHYIMSQNNAYHPRSGMAWSPTDFDDRVREVYHLCFERAETKAEKAKVIADFIAYFPHLQWGTLWIKVFVNRFPGNRGWFLEAVRKGYSRSGSAMLRKRSERSSRVEHGFVLFPKIYEDLRKELDQIEPTVSLNPSHTQQDVRQRAIKEIKELLGTCIKDCPRPRRIKVSNRLNRLLRGNEARKAAVLIAATRAGCRERDLEERLHWGRGE